MAPEKTERTDRKTTGSQVATRRISEDWLAAALGLAVILLIHLGDVTVKWPLFEWLGK